MINLDQVNRFWGGRAGVQFGVASLKCLLYIQVKMRKQLYIQSGVQERSELEVIVDREE